MLLLLYSSSIIAPDRRQIINYCQLSKLTRRNILVKSKYWDQANSTAKYSSPVICQHSSSNYNNFNRSSISKHRASLLQPKFVHKYIVIQRYNEAK